MAFESDLCLWGLGQLGLNNCRVNRWSQVRPGSIMSCKCGLCSSCFLDGCLAYLHVLSTVVFLESSVVCVQFTVCGVMVVFQL